MQISDYDLIAIIGPTASGKTRRAVEIARQYNAEIISGDSRQVYKGMDIGTGKDLCEYKEIPYHLIDICPAGYKYNLHEFIRDCNCAIESIKQRNKNVILCGGTGLYIESILNGIRLPEVPQNNQLREELNGKSIDELREILQQYKTLHNTTDLDSCKRAIRAIEIQEYYRQYPEAYIQSRKETSIKPNALVIGIDIDRESRRSKISSRLEQRLKEGMIEEVKGLLDSGIPAQDLIYYGLEYKFVTQHILGELSYQEMYHQLEIAIHQFAKRQMTWFRGMEKRGIKINWLRFDLEETEFLTKFEEILKYRNREC